MPFPNTDGGGWFAQRVRRLGERYAAGVARGDYFYQRAIERDEGAWVWVGGRRLLMLASYSYLGLADHPRIAAAATEAMARYGTGTHGVRLLAGTTALHVALEDAIARFTRTEAAMVYSSGYAANVATISALLTRGDTVICDRLSHASLYDGCLLAGASISVFRHNDLDDLRHLLRRRDGRGTLVIVDAVYSMDGDVAPVPDIAALCHACGATLLVDEAHSLGVLGATGRGIEEQFGLDPTAIDIKVGTLSKAIPSVGGYVAGSAALIAALKHNARAFIFSGALPPPQTAAAVAALEVLADEPWRVTTLQENARRYRDGVRALGFDTLQSTTPIVPIQCRSESTAYAMTRACQEGGLFVAPIVAPAVPARSPRLRTTVTAAHTAEEIDRALTVLQDAGNACGLI